jgi:AraC-like DNA-binding protein
MSLHPHDAWLYQPVTPMIYIQTALRIAKERGMDTTQLAHQLGIGDAEICDVDAMITPIVHAWLIVLIIAETGDHGLGFEIGLRLPPTAHGNLGLAILCCGTMREAFGLLARYWYLRERVATLSILEQDDVVVLHLHSDKQYPDILRVMHLQTILAMCARVIPLLLGESRLAGECWLDSPEPDYYARYRERLAPIRYGMPAVQVRLPIAILERPLIMSNPEALAHAVEECERESRLLGGDARDLLGFIRDKMICDAGHYPMPEDFMAKLHISRSTLSRRLHACGTSYKQLLEQAQIRDALRLLDNPSLDIQTIAHRLGYLNPANFTRAFKQWTGQTPSGYRELRAAG